MGNRRAPSACAPAPPSAGLLPVALVRPLVIDLLRAAIAPQRRQPGDVAEVRLLASPAEAVFASAAVRVMPRAGFRVHRSPQCLVLLGVPDLIERTGQIAVDLPHPER